MLVVTLYTEEKRSVTTSAGSWVGLPLKSDLCCTSVAMIVIDGLVVVVVVVVVCRLSYGVSCLDSFNVCALSSLSLSLSLSLVSNFSTVLLFVLCRLIVSSHIGSSLSSSSSSSSSCVVVYVMQ